MENVLALETMKEGHDGSGMGLALKDLGGEFRDLKSYPVLSGICSDEGMQVLNQFMGKQGFKEVHSWSPKIRPVKGIAPRDHYFAKFYKMPAAFKGKSREEQEELLVRTRLALRKLGEKDESIVVFSFYPDVIVLKEVGDPLELAEFFSLDNTALKAKVVLAQGRQNTNYAINLYACHPFFLQGYCSMTNGENTAFVPIREYLLGRDVPGYVGYNSDSEVFSHILHYTVQKLGYPLTYYKDIITPLAPAEMAGRSDREALMLLRQSLRMLIIDGPNCNIGFLPDGTVYMVQDAKKLRPGAVGGVAGDKFALMSESCGVEKVVPNRDRSTDIFPMKYDMVIIAPGAKEVRVWNQLKG